MPWSNGVYTPPTGAENAFAGKIIASATWNAVFTDVASGITTAGAPPQRSVTASPIVISATDVILNVNINTGTPTCALPAAATRAGLPLIFVDVGLHAAAHNWTLTPNGAETIVNAPTPSALTVNSNGTVVTLYPFNDGTNTGWFMA